MKIVVAMDSFKGSVTARDACAAARRGVLSVMPDAEVVECPMADGGEGTAETLREARGGEDVRVEVCGPLPGMRVEGGFSWLAESGPGALVEMATASGLELLPPDRRNPLETTTYGTGELVAAARDRGARNLWLAVGGSATVDGGTGAAAALGWRFVDEAGVDVGLGGKALERIARIETPAEPWVMRVRVLCDVDNPLLGLRGAAHVFGPQKGATGDMVERLEAGLANLADVIERDLGRDVRDLPGAGAAGGLGAGAVAFLGAELGPGVEAVMDAVGLNEALRGAAWVLTGEGRYDRQSLTGKVVSGVVKRSRLSGARIAVVAGSAAIGAAQGGVDVVQEVRPPSMPLEEALARGAELIEKAAAGVAVAHLTRT